MEQSKPHENNVNMQQILKGEGKRELWRAVSQAILGRADCMFDLVHPTVVVLIEIGD